MLVAGRVASSKRQEIAELAVKSRLPAIYPQTEYTEAGGLMYYGANILDLHRRAALHVDKILKGAKPADLACRATEEVRVRHQSQNCKANRFDDSAQRAGAGG